MRKKNSLKLSNNQRKLISVLNEELQRPQDIKRKLNLSHSSLYLAFSVLEKRGLVKEKRLDNKIHWVKSKLAFDFEKLINKDVTKNEFKNIAVNVYDNKKDIKNCISEILNLSEGARVTIMQADQKNSGWFDLFSKEETKILNQVLSRKKIICENIMPENFLNEHLQILGKDWLESYFNRPIVNYKFKEKIVSDSILILFMNRVIILQAKDDVAIEIINSDTYNLVNGLLNVLKLKQKL
jgi:hypothetical protein